MIQQLSVNPASFRDPRGRIYELDNRVFRTIMPVAKEDFDFVRDSELIKTLVLKNKLLAESFVDIPDLRERQPEASYFLEHPRLAFISYPYEWSFAALKKAALLFLDIHLQALEHGVTLTDASAYNIQFQNAAPIYIDHLSFCRYIPGQIWVGYQQFCEQFLFPLLLQAYGNIPFQELYRSKIDGITAEILKLVFPWYRKLSPKVFLHIILPTFSRHIPNESAGELLPKINFTLTALKKLLINLQKWIQQLQIKQKKTVWSDYAQEQNIEKQSAVKEFVQQVKPKLLFDLGCNIGNYSLLALQNGAKTVVGFESDLGALEKAFQIASCHSVDFLPLYMNLANPSPGQGWCEKERKGFAVRTQGDAIIALAIIHHLVITHQIPLSQVVDWLISLAPQGLIEFVPKVDPKIKDMLRLRDDIFSNYSYEHFLFCIQQKAKVIKTWQVSQSGRMIVWYQKFS